MTSYDGHSFTFNGYGIFLVTRSNDNSFELQGQTIIIENLKDSSISGTLFSSFALRTNESSIFEVRLNSTDWNFPKIC